VATSHRRAGVAITILAAIGAVVGMTMGHLSIPIGCGIAVIGIVIGAGVARGRFSRTPAVEKKK
jgi:hypothetical protein